MKTLLVWMVSVCLLAGCGGGGGSSSWISFDRDPVRVEMYQGESPEIRLKGTASSNPDVYVNVGAVADPTLFDLSSVSTDRVGTSATFRGKLLATLTEGTHNGYIEVRVCEDSIATCAVPYDASPWRVSVIVEVKADPHNPTSPANGDFAGGMEGWKTYVWDGGAANFTATGGELHANISSKGSSIFAVQLASSTGIDLEAGRTYRFSFRARADAVRTIQAYVDEGRDRDGDRTGTIYIQPVPTFTLGTTMQTFSAEFTMNETNRAAGIFFVLGGSDADVYLDDVTVTDVTR